ncbi:MAG: hypothetical protein B6D58_01465 [candidate division Zixibacteria bacterium 4484_95]|nr:MAG: hypothetical protein B6D58_01465 [candidate division Zixibacteria bacterium 4484_95]
MIKMVQVALRENRIHTLKQDGYQFKIFFWHNLMIAHLTIEQIDHYAVFKFTIEDLIEILKKAGIVYGIRKEQLEKVINNTILNKSIEVARGTFPERGKDADIEFLFDTTKSKTPVVQNDGYIDYKNLNIIRNAVVGQPLAKKVHAVRGKSGITVTGEKVEGLMGRDRALPKGKNTYISSDNPDLLVSTIDGAITFNDNVVSVERNYKLRSDVDTSTGNIEFVGNLHISGSVRAGFRIKVDGDVEIDKNIEDAEVISGGSVVAKGGFIGSGKGLIKAKNDVFIKYIGNQRIVAGNNVKIIDEAMNAQVEAGNAVYLKGEGSIIVGGQVSACNLVDVNSIGSEMGIRTLVRVGYDKILMEKYTNVKTEVNSLQNDKAKIGKEVKTLLGLKKDDELNEEQRLLLLQLKKKQAEISKKIEEMEGKGNELLTEIQENKIAKIVVRGNIYPGTTIQIGILKKEIPQELKNMTFQIYQGRIISISNT